MVRPFRFHPIAFAAASLAGTLALTSAASGQAYNPAQLPGAQIAQVDHACRATIGLEPGEAQYSACVASLSGSVRGADDQRSLTEARRNCRREGYGRGTPGLAECALNSAAETAPGEPEPITSPRAAPARSYFQASRDEVFRREQAACATLGLDPTSAGFTDCVANLRSAIFNANYPD